MFDIDKFEITVPCENDIEVAFKAVSKAFQFAREDKSPTDLLNTLENRFQVETAIKLLNALSDSHNIVTQMQALALIAGEEVLLRSLNKGKDHYKEDTMEDLDTDELIKAIEEWLDGDEDW